MIVEVCPATEHRSPKVGDELHEQDRGQVVPPHVQQQESPIKFATKAHCSFQTGTRCDFWTPTHEMIIQV